MHYLDCFYSRSVELYFSLSHLLKCGTIFKCNASFFFFLSQHLQTQYDSLFPTLCNDHPDIFPREVYTWEQFLWACELWYSNSMQVMFPDGKLRTCLIPIAGFLNHSVCHSFCSPFFFILLLCFFFFFLSSWLRYNFRFQYSDYTTEFNWNLRYSKLDAKHTLLCLWSTDNSQRCHLLCLTLVREISDMASNKMYKITKLNTESIY